jgi:hypothetical protein
MKDWDSVSVWADLPGGFGRPSSLVEFTLRKNS